MRYSALLLAPLFLTGAPSAAQQSAAGNGQTPHKPETVVVTGEQPKENKKVCQRTVPTGSIMPQTVCRTQAESEEIRDRSLAEMERIRKERRDDQQLRVNINMKDLQ
jgi:hypothetical protein